MKVPSYRLHKSSGQAVVTLNKVDVYLGVYDTPESRELYKRKVAEWLAGSGAAPVEPSRDTTVSEVLAAYLHHARTRYRGAQLRRVKQALALCREHYGTAPAADFRGKALKACRAALVRQGLNRRVINQRVDCLRLCFRWALAEEMVPAEAVASLAAVAGLREGETDAPEPKEVPPVAAETVEATLPFLPPFLADAARAQLLSGLRPGEVLAVRADQLDRSRPDLWVWRPRKHKTAWRGHVKQGFFGPRGIALLDQYLMRRCPCCGVEGRTGRLGFRAGLCGPCQPRLDEGPWPDRVIVTEHYLFSPRVAEAERLADLRARRKSKVQPSQASRRKASPAKGPGETYDRDYYCRRVGQACKRAGVPHWHPHQLRHSAATAISAEFGLEMARIILGQKSLDVTKIYAADDVARAADVVRKIG